MGKLGGEAVERLSHDVAIGSGHADELHPQRQRALHDGLFKHVDVDPIGGARGGAIIGAIDRRALHLEHDIFRRGADIGGQERHRRRRDREPVAELRGRVGRDHFGDDVLQFNGFHKYEVLRACGLPLSPPAGLALHGDGLKEFIGKKLASGGRFQGHRAILAHGPEVV